MCAPRNSTHTKKTKNQKQTLKSIKSDVTRHRYGDEAHLDTTVKFLGLVMPQADYPQLQYISQVRHHTPPVS